MVELKAGHVDYAPALAGLVYASAPEVLGFLFGSQTNALDFISKAATAEDGQFSVFRHRFALYNGKPVGVVSHWYSELPQSFQTQTLNSLYKFLPPTLLPHIFKVNPLLLESFAPPATHQVCFGHLAVLESYRGRDIGSKLLAYIMDEARAMQKTEMALDVLSSNETAISFYHRWGFIEQKASFFAPTKQEYIRMIRALN